MIASPPLSVGIIGLGRIAEGYDAPTDEGVTTHIKACLHDPRLEIKWIADLDAARAARVAAKWGLKAAPVTPDALIKARPDILCIAGPDETHAGLAEAALAHPPRLILCEKPLGSDFAAIARLVAAATQARVPLAVNFPRRWLPGVASWLGDAKAGRHGDPVAACVIYCRGLRHNACHGLDLVGAAFGSDGVTARRLAGAVDDFASSDPTVSGTLTVKGPTGSVTITVTGVDGRRANLFETDILFTGGRLRVWNEGGIRWQIFGPGPAAAHGGRELHVIQQSHDNPPRHMLAVWRNIADHLSKGQPLLCGAPDTLAGSALVEAIAQAPPLPL